MSDETIWFTIYEPRRRWHGRLACRYTIRRHIKVPIGALVTPLAEGWMPNLGLGYRTVELPKPQVVHRVTNTKTGETHDVEFATARRFRDE